MAKAPALPPSVKTGLSAADSGGPAGTPVSDAEVFSRLSASTGIDKIRNGAPSEPAASEPEVPVVAPENTAPAEGFDLEEGLPESLKSAPREAGKPTQSDETPPGEGETAPEGEPAPEKPKPVAKDLRSQLEKFSSEAKALAKERDTLTTRLRELEEQVKDVPNAKTLSGELSKREQKIQELEKQLAYLDYTQSAEFAERYQKPYEAKLTEAFKELKTLSKEDGSKLTDAEIEGLVLGGEREAYRIIDESFSGADSRLAARLVSEVYGSARDKELAMKNARTEAQARKDKQTAALTQFQTAYKGMFEQNLKAIKEKFPDLYVPNEKDQEAQALFQAGYSLVDAAFNKRKDLSPDQLARVEAEIYNRAGAFPALRLRALRAERELAAVKKELSKFKGNTPGRGEPAAGESEGGGPTPEIGSKAYIERGLREAQRRIRD